MEELRNHRKKHITETFHCTACGVQTSSLDELRDHSKIHGTDTFPCNQCDYEVKEKKLLDKHKIVDHFEIVYVCDLCDFSTQCEDELNTHMSTVHNRTKLCCKTCQKTFKTVLLLKEHNQMEHLTPPSFPCDQCKFKADTVSNLDKHILSHHERNHRQNRPTKNYKNRDERSRNGPCFFWNQGYCKNGDRCEYDHIEVCLFQGNCRFGSQCRYPHISYGNSHFF